MTFISLMNAVADAVFWPSFVLGLLGYISRKTMNKWYCVAFSLMFMADAVAGRHWSATLDLLIAVFNYWAWKRGKDDDQRPKRKRQALRSKFDKVLPRPVVRAAPSV